MVQFYRNLWQKRMNKVAALREAQLAMLRNYDLGSGKLRERGSSPISGQNSQQLKLLPPYYWAAFVLSGDWR